MITIKYKTMNSRTIDKKFALGVDALHQTFELIGVCQ